MALEIGHIEAIYRYPVKSMGAQQLTAANLGWHGIDGDRRFAFCRAGVHGGMPWLTASRLPALVCYTPLTPDAEALPTHVRTPEGLELPLLAEALDLDVGRRFGAPVQLLHLRHGIFDEASISLICIETVREICQLAGRDVDVLRFRPNIVVRATRALAFEEDAWLSAVLGFGDADDAPRVSVTTRDERCAMVNIDPEHGGRDPRVLKAVVRANQNRAGVYATVLRPGRLFVGQKITLRVL